MGLYVHSLTPEPYKTAKSLELSERLRRLVVNALEKKAGPESRGLNRADLSFDSVGVEPTGLDEFFAVAHVCVAANVTNNSASTIPLIALPMIYCLETGTCSKCLPKERRGRKAIAPGETMAVEWQVYARDVFIWWALVQADEDPYAERWSFSGLDALPALIEDVLTEYFDELMKCLAKEHHEEMADEDNKINWYDKWVMLATQRRFIVDEGECFHMSALCSDMYEPYQVDIRTAHIDGYQPCLKCVGSDWWVGEWIGYYWTCALPSGTGVPTTGSVWVSTSEGELVAHIGPDDWVEDFPLRAIAHGFDNKYRWVWRHAGITRMPASEVLSRFFVRLTSPEAIRNNGGCRYRLNKVALLDWRSRRSGGRQDAFDSPAPVEHAWWISDIDNMRRRYVELRDDEEALKELFPGHSIDDIRGQARKMGLERPEPTDRKAKSGTTPRTAKKRQIRTPDANGRAKNKDSRREAARSPKPAQRKQQRAPGKMSAAELHTRPWTPEEDAVVRKWYPRYGANIVDWPDKLYGRKKTATEQRARELRLGSR